ncbi:MAG: tRNA (guanosine(46)-N7)-methyltransferase TrmB [Snowella sp.]|nr:tRNA (guanosine(46)-N7)-methyltransferase TrmB [Snowella sp.]
MTRVRVRQHVNPLSQKYRTAIAVPDWSQIYGNVSQPLHLDIGCARGKFLLQMAPLQPDWNFLGVEIREALVIEANQQRDHLTLTNLHFLFGNMNSTPLLFLNSLPATLARVSIQFPDPWFKQRHSKRRVVQTELVTALGECLSLQGQILLQSDVELVAQEMSDRFLENPRFQKTHLEPWLMFNPFPVSTERENACLNLERPVYRVLLTKTC